jgi:hypothetical protein
MNCTQLGSGDPRAFGCELQGLGQATSGFLANIDPAIGLVFMILIAGFVLILLLAGSRVVGLR